jgi:hypothetical protein
MKTNPWFFLVASALTACAAFADDIPTDPTPTDHAARTAIDQGFKFELPLRVAKASPSVTATSVSLPAAAAAGTEANDLVTATKAEPVQMPAYQVRDIADHTYRELNESVAVRQLLAPCVIYKQDHSHGLEVQEIGAPLKPMAGDTRHEDQARFPLVTLAW